MRCTIIDDEPLAREGMELNVEELDYLNLVGQFSTEVDALNFLNHTQVDLIFFGYSDARINWFVIHHL